MLLRDNFAVAKALLAMSSTPGKTFSAEDAEK
jgi:hypothetical protein